MANKDYIERLKQVIFHRHKTDSYHIDSVEVKEVFQGETVWQGVVEVFLLTKHPEAKRCYAWSHPTGKLDKDQRFVTVLEVPPVKSAQTAVKVTVAPEVKGNKK